MTNVNARRYCKRCEKEMPVRLVRNITASGISQVYWLCVIGNHPIGKPGTDWIDHKKIRAAGYDPNDLPVIKDYVEEYSQPCAVCGLRLGTELHHFAPRHLFKGDADRWPTAYLCEYHHKQWHALVTPNMARVNQHGQRQPTTSQV